MKKPLFKILTSFILLVFVVGTMPKEYLHDLISDHVDTVHRDYKKGELEFSGNHKHCSFVGFAFAPYISAEKHFFSFEEVSVHINKYILPLYCFRYTTFSSVIALRGPPALS